MKWSVSHNNLAYNLALEQCRGNYQRDIIRGWCGQAPRTTYSYVWWSDGSAKPRRDSGHWFCNLACFHAYND